MLFQFLERLARLADEYGGFGDDTETSVVYER